jgi:hypothetical protein
MPTFTQHDSLYLSGVFRYNFVYGGYALDSVRLPDKNAFPDAFRRLAEVR